MKTEKIKGRTRKSRRRIKEEKKRRRQQSTRGQKRKVEEKEKEEKEGEEMKAEAGTVLQELKLVLYFKILKEDIALKVESCQKRKSDKKSYKAKGKIKKKKN
jgi:hypothetical protein